MGGDDSGAHGGERVHIIAYNATEQTRITNLLAAAAVVAVGVFVLSDRSDKSDSSDTQPALVAAPRVTQQLTTRLASLDDDITATRTRIARGRYTGTTTL